MKKIKNYQEFTNEEINLKKAITGAALGASLALSNPSISQTNLQGKELSQTANNQIDSKISGWEGLKWGDSIDDVKRKFPNSEDFKNYYHSEENDSISLKINNYKLSTGYNDSISGDVLLYFDKDKRLKSVVINILSDDSNFKKIKNYLNSNYWQGNSPVVDEPGTSKSIWKGELGEIVLSEEYQSSSTYSTGYQQNQYQTKIIISKSSKSFDMIQLTDSQKFDMLRNELINMKNEQNEIKLNLYKCQQEFKVGVGLVGAGIGIGILGSALIRDNSEIGKPVVILGSVLSLAGSVVIVDSHKFIGRASLAGLKINIKDEKKPSFDKIQPGDYFLYMGPNQ